LNRHHFLVVGLFGIGGPVTVRLEEMPFVNQQLKTGAGWTGVEAGTKLRVTYLSINGDGESEAGIYPKNVIHVVEV
jgi:hypothetical protein